MKNYIIGISAFFHDSSVCLFKDGKLVFAVEEERFTGVKYESSFPYNSLNYITERYKIKSNDIECICFYEIPGLKLERIINNFFKNPIRSFKYSVNSIIEFIKHDKILNKIDNKLYFEKHHNSHLFYSYYTSPFKNSIVLSVDGVGEFDTMAYSTVKDDEFQINTLLSYPHSLGLFYSAMTSFIGFKPNSGEYKLMGLAGFGDPNRYYDKLYSVIQPTKKGKLFNMRYFDWNVSNNVMFNLKLSNLLDIPNRLPEDEIEQKHKDIAATTQKIYEELLFDTLINIHKQTDGKFDTLCLGGGCAYNGVANGKITTHTPFKEVWIPPSPSDAGSSIGAVLGYLHTNRKKIKRISKNPFLGPNYTDTHIKKQLPDLKLVRHTDDELYTIVSTLLGEGKTIGWCRGRIEFGARALGNRSILANPFIPGTRDKINDIIKKREGFRPFAPMVLYNEQSTYFETDVYIPYMNQVVNVKEPYKGLLNEVSNVDGSARVQSITKKDNPSMFNLLTTFSNKTKQPPILLNTSFNVRGQTMVLTPKMAYDTFMTTDLDVLVLNNFIITKR